MYTASESLNTVEFPTKSGLLLKFRRISIRIRVKFHLRASPNKIQITVSNPLSAAEKILFKTPTVYFIPTTRAFDPYSDFHGKPDVRAL
jgi:hypothetical protein